MAIVGEKLVVKLAKSLSDRFGLDLVRVGIDERGRYEIAVQCPTSKMFGVVKARPDQINNKLDACVREQFAQVVTKLQMAAAQQVAWEA